MSLNQQKKGIVQQSMDKARVFASAVVLASGLALLPGCKNDVGYTELKRTPAAKIEASAQPVSDVIRQIAKECNYEQDCMNKKASEMQAAGNVKLQDASSQNMSVQLPKKSQTSTIKAGDVVTVCAIPTPGAATFYIKAEVTKIDKTGVTLKLENPGVLAFEDAFTLNYGQEKQIGEYVLSFRFKAEKGSTPGTAKLTITTPKLPQEYLNCGSDPSVSMVCRADKSVLKVGDSVLTIEFLFEKAGWFSIPVTKIDDKGIEIGAYMEIFMSEQASSKSMLRVDFGETKTLTTGDYALTQSVSVKAEKGPTPDSAIVTVIGTDAESK